VKRKAEDDCDWLKYLLIFVGIIDNIFLKVEQKL